MDAPSFTASPGTQATDPERYDEPACCPSCGTALRRAIAPAPKSGRDFYLEAERIVAGRTLLLPERRHLIALFAAIAKLGGPQS